MGAANVIKAFDLYAGLVPPVSMLLLVRMALVSSDSDCDPWFCEGHEALARRALGRGRHAEVTHQDLKAVERAMTPLFKVGAIATSRRAAIRLDGRSTAKYQLNLQGAHTPRKTGGVDDLQVAHTGRKTSYVGTAQVVTSDPPHPPENRGRHSLQDPPHPPKSGAHTPRNSGGRGVREEKKDKDLVVERGTDVAVSEPALAKILRHPSAELAIITDSRLPAVTAQTITGEWIDHCGAHSVILTKRVIGQYAKSIKEALDAGFTPNLIKRALGRMLSDAQASWPGSFDAYLVRVQEQPNGAPPRKLTPGEESAQRLIAGADNPGVVIDAVRRFFDKGAS